MPISTRLSRFRFLFALALLSSALGGGVARAQAPRIAAPPSAAPAARDVIDVHGAVDIRYRSSSGDEENGGYLAAGRLTADWERHNRKQAGIQAGGRAQVYLERDDRRRRDTDHLRLSEAFVFYDFTLPGVSARVKAGQFVLPFGLIYVYDTPLQPIQPLYEKSLGLRVDGGVMMEGEYGPYRYAAALTTGAGPNRPRIDSSRLFTFRLGRSVDTRLGRFEVGGSLQTGRGPRTTFATELPPSGYNGTHDFIDRTRIAGDGQYFFGPLVLRGELVFGGDDEEPVWGYFGEGEYHVTSRAALVATRKLWNFPEKPMSSAVTGVGVNYDFGRGFAIRTLYEFQRDVPLPAGTDPVVTKRITLQTRLNF